MCRLFGITNFKYTKHRPLVENFCDLARNGFVMAGDPPGHGDGWGMAFYLNGKMEVHKSGAGILDEKDKVLGILSRVGECPVIILHLRKSAWNDSTNTRHAHPFLYKNTAFAHNGTVYDYKGLIPDITIPIGEDALDTEVFFLHFMSDNSCEIDQAFSNTVSLIKRGSSFSALNCLFSDGKKLFAYRDYSKEPDYYSLFKAYSENSHIISSQPLDENIHWELMEKGEYQAVKLSEVEKSLGKMQVGRVNKVNISG